MFTSIQVRARPFLCVHAQFVHVLLRHVIIVTVATTFTVLAIKKVKVVAWWWFI